MKPNYDTLKQFATRYYPKDWLHKEMLIDTNFVYHKHPESVSRR